MNCLPEEPEEPALYCVQFILLRGTRVSSEGGNSYEVAAAEGFTETGKRRWLQGAQALLAFSLVSPSAFPHRLKSSSSPKPAIFFFWYHML